MSLLHYDYMHIYINIYTHLLIKKFDHPQIFYIFLTTKLLIVLHTIYKMNLIYSKVCL